MKNLIYILLFVIGNSIYAQDTLTYFVAKSGKETSKENAVGYRKVVQTTEGTFLVKDYYLDGKLQMTGAYLTDSLKKRTGLFEQYSANGKTEFKSTYINGKKNGKSLTYHVSGYVKYSIDFVQGKKHGQLETYWENGTKKREEKYINGNFVEGTCYNNLGAKIEHFPFMVLPELPGGKNSIYKFLSDNVTYPSKAKTNGIQGKVYINFTVGKSGKLRNIRVLRGSHPLLDKEALRVVNTMPTWIPGKQDGENVSVSYNLPINFQLSKLTKEERKTEATIFYNKGNKFFKKNNLDKAIFFYSKTIEVDYKNKNAYFNRALSYAKLNKSEKACLDWKKAVELGHEKSQLYLDERCK
jgi:TonB family protein